MQRIENAAITGSFDGLHKGHEYIITKAKEQCHKLYILLGKNPDKRTTFDLPLQIQHIKKVFNDPSIIVTGYDESLVVDFCTRHNISTIFKGIRNEEDIQNENVQTFYNQFLAPHITTQYIGYNNDECPITIPTISEKITENYNYLSSSGIKMITKLGGHITPGIEKLVSLRIKQDLEKTLNNQDIIGITGVPGSGKSYIAEQLVAQARGLDIPTIHINMDKLLHKIYDQANYGYIRDQILELDPSITTNNNGEINRNSVRNAMFSSQSIKDKINRLFQQPIRTELRQEVYGKTGIILIESALFAEHNISDIVNNNLILVKTDSNTQLNRLQKRGDDMSTITQFLDGQYNTETKQKVLEEKINQSGHGTIITVDNSGSELSLSHIIDDIKKTVSYV